MPFPLSTPAQPRALALAQPGLPLSRAPAPADHKAAARRFETMVLEQVLAQVRKAAPEGTPASDTLFSAGQDLTDQQIDRQRAELIARAAPFGVARLLERTAK
jgi:Rod binding domain-containing protein